MKLSCDCGQVHEFTAGEVERIVHALTGAYADASRQDAAVQAGDPYDAVPCLKEVLGWSYDCEMYSEHVQAAVDARLLRQEATGEDDLLNSLKRYQFTDAFQEHPLENCVEFRSLVELARDRKRRNIEFIGTGKLVQALANIDPVVQHAAEQGVVEMTSRNASTREVIEYLNTLNLTDAEWTVAIYALGHYTARIGL